MDQTGRLHVRVYTSRAQIPVPGARVVVTGKGDNGKLTLLSIQTTDSSGEISPVEIAAPQAADSTAPEAAGGPPPFALCDVWAEHPGFAMLVVEDVQIFPGIETEQAMVLSPLSEGQSSLTQTDVQQTPAQDL
jgi:hypothetical protein